MAGVLILFVRGLVNWRAVRRSAMLSQRSAGGLASATPPDSIAAAFARPVLLLESGWIQAPWSSTFSGRRF
jgi:hypothetical protein